MNLLLVCPVWHWLANGTVRAQRVCNVLLLENNALKFYSVCKKKTQSKRDVFKSQHHKLGGYVVAQSVEALCYKLEGCRFDSRWCHWKFSLT